MHYNRVLRNIQLILREYDYFGNLDYLLRDSKLTYGLYMVYSSKNTIGSHIGLNESALNNILAKSRVNIENCIGSLKGRYPWLRNISARIMDRSSLRIAFAYVKTSGILQNSLINEKFNEEWIEE